jgi:hypothetical protein
LPRAGSPTIQITSLSMPGRRSLTVLCFMGKGGADWARFCVALSTSKQYHEVDTPRPMRNSSSAAVYSGLQPAAKPVK